MTNRTYETPAVTALGSFEDITRGGTQGTRLDASIPVGFPQSQVPGFVASHLS